MQMKLMMFRTFRMVQAMKQMSLYGKYMSLTTTAYTHAMTFQGVKKPITHSQPVQGKEFIIHKHVIRDINLIPANAVSCSFLRASSSMTVVMMRAMPPNRENTADMMSKFRTGKIRAIVKNDLLVPVLNAKSP
jgi:hypothetical protein